MLLLVCLRTLQYCIFSHWCLVLNFTVQHIFPKWLKSLCSTNRCGGAAFNKQKSYRDCSTWLFLKKLFFLSFKSETPLSDFCTKHPQSFSLCTKPNSVSFHIVEFPHRDLLFVQFSLYFLIIQKVVTSARRYSAIIVWVVVYKLVDNVNYHSNSVSKQL